MTVPALLPLLPAAMGVNFVDLGIAIGLFNIVSALCQAPLGFAVDRFGARRMLIGGLTLGAISFTLLAVSPSYPMLLFAMVVAGLANGVYHPADYAILSRGMDTERMGRAFSFHTFAGFLGGAVTPPIMIGMALAFDLRWAFACSSAASMIALVIILVGPDMGPFPERENRDAQRTTLARPVPVARRSILVLTILFMILNLSTGAIERFSVSALVEGFAVTLSTANIALTAFLFASASGVLVGGYLADRTERHGFVAATAFAMAALLVAMVILVPLPDALLILTMGAAGFLTGIVAPSRDMLVRAAAPPGQEGKIFGIVSTGFNIGGVIGPILFGFLLDSRLPSAVLWASVGFMVITALIVIGQERRRTAALCHAA